MPIYITTLLFLTNIFTANAASDPLGLDGHGLPGNAIGADKIVGKIGGNFIGDMIQYVAVIAVISLMVSGIMYLTSGGEEEKVNKAKSWVIYSLVGVFLSISAWAIINILNQLTIK